MDLSSINKENNINEKIKEYNELVKIVSSEVDNFDYAVEKITNEFRIKSENSTKGFYKIAKNKKSVKKDYFKYYDKNIYSLWKGMIEVNVKFILDCKNLLDKDIYYSYLIGMYIVIHSKKFRGKMNDFIKTTLAEMAYKATLKVNSNDLPMREERFVL
jgi:hypothetical protein